jgi:hypothetical protein
MAEPEELFRDTEAIVSQWGLRKTAHHRSPQD